MDERVEEIYVKYHLLVKDVAFKMLKDFYLAQDVCHDVFSHMTAQCIDKYHTPEQMRAYLYVAAHNRAIDYTRKGGWNKEVPYPEHAKSHFDRGVYDRIEENMDRKIFISQLFLDVKEFRPDWHDVLVRTEVYQESAEMVAQKLGISVGQVRSKLCRVKKWLRRKHGSRYGKL